MGSVTNLGCCNGIGYGIGLAFYNVGGSVPIGISRSFFASYYLINHYFRIYLQGLELPSETAKRIQKSTDHEIENLSRYRFTDYRSAEEQIDFWFFQIFRGISEICFPVIGSLAWTFADLQDQYQGSDRLFDGSTFAVNLCGINDLNVARQWEVTTARALAIQRL